MKYVIPQNVEELKAYVPISVHPEVRMDANEGCFPIPTHILEEFRAALAGFDFNRYPDPSAMNVCENFGEFYNIDPNSVVLGNGSDELLSLIITCMVGREQKLLLFAPDFSMYKFYADLAGIDLVTVEKPKKIEDFDGEFIKKTIKANNPGVVLFSNPCNPTSHGITTDEIRDILNSTEALIVLDEAYMDFGEESFLPYYKEHENLIILKTASKGLGFANARLGFFISSEYFVNIIKKIKSPYNVNGITQLLGEIIFSNKEIMNKRIDSIKKEREKLYEKLAPFFEIPKPSGNFLFLKSEKSIEIRDKLMEKNIAIKDFGGYLRITVGTAEENTALLEAMEEERYINIARE